ncbi:cytochrome P450 [Panus rudis PR-1116 ss-1]|nr:cytochrome P450 [Panus rudis PR-1116 ss-1]
MPHPFSRYRLRFLHDVVRIVVLPSVTLATALSVLHVRLGLLTIPAYVSFIVVAAAVRNRHDLHQQRRQALQRGARMVPVVVGKWPGNLDVLLRMKREVKSRYLCDFFLDLFQEYQSTIVNLRILGADLFVTMDEEHIKFISATGFNNFWRGRKQKERLELFLGNGIFNRDDDEWRLHRNMARPFFARERISDMDLFGKYADSTLSIISSLTSGHAPIEVQDLYARFTLDTASEVLFGEKLNTLHGALPIPGQTGLSAKGSATNDEFGSFAQSFEKAQEIIIERTNRGYFWPIYQLFKDDVQPHAETIDRFLDPIISRVLLHKQQMRKAGIVSTVEHSTFLEYLTDNTEDPKVLRDQLLNILLASRDTTSCLLTFVTYIMAMHPEVARRLRAEVLEHVGPDRPPTLDDIKNLRYLHAVINETLRVFPPVPMNQRECRPQATMFPKSDRTFPEHSNTPVYVPPNTSVLFTTLLTHRNPSLWGPDADVFDPDRWLDERLSRFLENPMMFTPFSAGPRICLGQNYARNEASFFLVRLLQQFDTFTLAPEFQPEGSLPPADWANGRGRTAIEKLRPAFALTLFVKGGLWVRFGKAKDA